MIRRSYWKILGKDIRRDWELYLLILPVLANYIIFHYLPIYGLQIAFRRYNIGLGIAGSPWTGFTNFSNFFSSYYFLQMTWNTLIISLMLIVYGFPLPILFALLLNEVRRTGLRKGAQTISYLPYFISAVVLVGMLKQMLQTDGGIVNTIITFFGGESIYFLGKPGYFRSIYVLMELWRGTGFSAIIYIAAITSVDQELYEAAAMDGAGRLRRVWHVTLPCIIPTIVIMLILRMGSILNVGWQEILLLQNPLNADVSEVISTFVYKRAFEKNDFSYATAVGLINSLVGLIFVLATNAIAKRAGDTSLF
ncbi:MAG: ABC transporter permease subunit [Clostridia bacterium]|nr:ABC transporter permease subunit [Clostridia bacterium]